MQYAFAKSTREISLGLTLPAYRNRQRNAQHKTDMLTYIGQFFNHDIDLRAMGIDDPANRIDVEIDHCDFRFNRDKCSDSNAAATSFSMIRSQGEVSDGTRQQVETQSIFTFPRARPRSTRSRRIWMEALFMDPTRRRRTSCDRDTRERC